MKSGKTKTRVGIDIENLLLNLVAEENSKSESTVFL